MKRARDVAEAVRIAEELAIDAGLPRCGHLRWSVGDEAAIAALYHRGRIQWCTCKSATEVDVDCPHVTWGAVAVIEVDGAVLLHGDAKALDAHPEAAALPAARMAREQLELAEVRYEPREVARHLARPEALRETEPAPPERGARR